MAFETSAKELKELLHSVLDDLEKAVAGNKAAAQRCRTKTVQLEKIGKVFRKDSINHDKS